MRACKAPGGGFLPRRVAAYFGRPTALRGGPPALRELATYPAWERAPTTLHALETTKLYRCWLAGRSRSRSSRARREGPEHLGRDRLLQPPRQHHRREPLPVGVTEARRLDEEPTLAAVDHPDALYRKGDALHHDLGVSQAEQAAAAPGVLQAGQHKGDHGGLSQSHVSVARWPRVGRPVD